MTSPLIVHTDWSRAWGGQEIRVLTELREMKKRGFRTGLIVPEDSELALRAHLEEIPVYPLDFSSKFNIPAWRSLFRLIRELRPTVLNTHSSEDSWMAGCAAKLCRVPLIVRTRHVLASISSAVSYNLFPDVIFACSEAIGHQLIEQGVAADKITVQSTGIDENRFQFSAVHRQRIRQQFNIREDDILVGNVAFLRHYKGHPFIIKTAAAMPSQYKFMIVGGGSDRKLLEEQIRDLGVADRFIITGHQEHPEEYFPAFDLIFFSSYEAEGVSQSFVQGLLYGLPLLVVRTPSILEPLQYVTNYRLIDYDDDDAACDGLRELSSLAKPERQAVEAQRHAVSSHYGLRAMMDNILRTYDRHGVKCVS